MSFHNDPSLRVAACVDEAFKALRAFRDEPSDVHVSTVMACVKQLSADGFHAVIAKRDMVLIVVREDVWQSMKKFQEVADGLGIDTQKHPGVSGQDITSGAIRSTNDRPGGSAGVNHGNLTRVQGAS